MPEPTVRERILQALENLPPDATFDDAIERLVFSAKIDAGLAELDAVTVPTLVVQGERDPFGIPPAGPAREVAKVPGDHSLKTDLEAVTAAVQTWISNLVAKAAPVA